MRRHDIDILLEHERQQAEQPLLQALLTTRCFGEGPARGAAGRLLEQHAPWATDLSSGLERLLEAPSPHQSALFVEVLTGGDDQTLEAVGRRHGMNAPAVGDAAQRAGRRIRTVLGDAPAPWPWLVAEIRRRLGGVTTDAVLGDALAPFGAAPGSLAALVASWLAGPLRPVRARPGWLARDPAALLRHTAGCVRADGGVRPLGDIAAELAELDIAAGMLVPWLQAFGAAVVHGLVVATTGPLADAAERLLDAHGTARSLPQLVEDLASGGRRVDEATLAASLRGRRFRTDGSGAVGLAAWGEAPVRAPARAPAARRPGRTQAPVRDAGAARSTTFGGGAVVQAAASRRGGQRQAGGKTAAPAGGERRWLCVDVDDAVLRGQEAAVPLALVEGLGIPAGRRQTFSSRWGPVTLAAEGPQSTRGSLRAVARAVGARHGQMLLLGFSPAGDLTVEVREAATGEPDGTGATRNERSGHCSESSSGPSTAAIVRGERPAEPSGTGAGPSGSRAPATTTRQGAR